MDADRLTPVVEVEVSGDTFRRERSILGDMEWHRCVDGEWRRASTAFWPYLDALADATREIDLMRADATANLTALSNLHRDHDDLWEERTRKSEALFFFASVIRSGEPWTEHCEAAMAKALLPLGHHRAAAEAIHG